MRRHPIFARFFAALAPMQLRRGESAKHRSDMLAGLTGRVIEVGAGSGLNFAFYPPEVSEVVALEPEPYLRQRAVEEARGLKVPITVMDGMAEQLPFEAGAFDAAVASLVLCSVDDQQIALAEMARVIRAGGELRFYEHVLSDSPQLARWQRRVDKGFWPFFGGGCHTSRDTLAAIQAAGFEVKDLERFTEDLGMVMAPVSPHILGRAIRA